MALLYENDCGFFLSHQTFLNQLYRQCIKSDCSEAIEIFKIKDEFFQINTPLLMDSAAAKIAKHLTCDKERIKRASSKKMGKAESEDQLTAMVKQAAQSVIDEVQCLGHISGGPVSASEWFDNNSSAREAAKSFLSKDCALNHTESSEFIQFSNHDGRSIIKNILSEDYIIPPKCSFLLGDMKYFHLVMDEMYDLVVLDPPWQNKSVKRKRQYSTVDCCDLLTLPMEQVIRPGSYVICWATNNQTQLKYIKEKLFTSWNVQHCADWQWVKITQKGDFFIHCQGNSSKKPYENLIIGQVPGSEESNLRKPEPQKVVVSVPSSIHSHKPPLSEVFKPYLPSNPKCLELFARYLLPGWTSMGNEVLKLQRLELFERIG